MKRLNGLPLPVTAENQNAGFYEAVSPFYDDLYPEVDADEAVRQWRLLIEERLQYKVNYQSAKRPRLLDLGCGTGRYLEPWASAGFMVIGTDVSKSMVKRARHRISTSAFQSRIHVTASDVRFPSSCLSRYRPFTLAVGHFNFLNLLTVADIVALLRMLKGIMAPDALLISDCASPQMMPAAAAEDCGLLDKKLHVRIRTEPEPSTCTVSMIYEIAGREIRERYWLHSREALADAAQTAGCRLRHAFPWCPSAPAHPWPTTKKRDAHRVCVFNFPSTP